MGKLKLFQVDSFTGQMFKGNPAGVCILTHDIPAETMQAIAMEMNLSETAFVRREGLEHRLRWFTPTNEVTLCGHATLAAAHVLFNHVGLKAHEIKFQTKSGLLMARKSTGGITLDFPIGNPEPTTLPEPIFDSLGIAHIDIEATLFCRTRNKFLVHLKDPSLIPEIKPDFGRMLEYQPSELIGVIITAKGEKHDFISRFFAPWVGVNEDPVTGSSHTVLAPYWSKLLGKTKMSAYQASKRGGEMAVELKGERVFLTGKAVTVFETEIDL
ncbi:MAG: PhzF family phenazine biosynthesis isomerase [Thermoplasmata archaeon]|nr:PhzF family phenazine biosynthesis isomerase [Thermoplasmata archaeon]